MEKLCVIDMNFTWPPDGGAPVNVVNLLGEYAKTYETTLLVPRLARLGRHLETPWPLSRTKFFLRGQVRFPSPPPFSLDVMSLSLHDFFPERFARLVAQRVAELRPDHVFIADAWYFKPILLEALRSYHPVVRLYVHETMCLKGHGVLYRNGSVCPIDYLDGSFRSYRACVGCAAGFYLTYPSPRWIMEFLFTRAFLRSYQRRCREALNLASSVLVGNRFIADRLQPFLKVPVRVAPAGITVSKFTPVAHEPGPDGITRILALGRLDSKIKGLPTLVRALQMLWASRQDFRLLVASRGKLPRAPFLEAAPWVRHEEIASLYHRARIVAIPSLWPDILPQVGFEAMAFGLPIVGSNVGGIPAQVEDGVNGFLVPPGDADALADRLRWLLDHPDEAARMGSRGRERVERLFSIDYVFDRYYRDLFAKDLPS